MNYYKALQANRHTTYRAIVRSKIGLIYTVTYWYQLNLLISIPARMRKTYTHTHTTHKISQRCEGKIAKKIINKLHFEHFKHKKKKQMKKVLFQVFGSVVVVIAPLFFLCMRSEKYRKPKVFAAFIIVSLVRALRCNKCCNTNESKRDETNSILR